MNIIFILKVKVICPVRMNDYIKVLGTIISLTHLLIYRVICFV